MFGGSRLLTDVAARLAQCKPTGVNCDHDREHVMSASFVPIEILTPSDSDTLPAGSLVYLPYGGSYSLFGVDQDGGRLLLDLGGEKPLHVWTIKDGGLGTAIVVEGWRIEVDPASALEVNNMQIPVGYAFTTADGTGLVGRQAVGRGAAMPMKSDGTIYKGGANSLRGAFQTWRIVTGPLERPQVLLTSTDVEVEPTA